MMQTTDEDRPALARGYGKQVKSGVGVPTGELPIRFHREGPGAYVSADGLFRIHRTTHTGRMYGAARIRWHVNYVPTGDNALHIGARPPMSHELSLEDAIFETNRKVGNGIVRFMRGLRELAQGTYQAELDREARIAEQRACEERCARLQEEILGELGLVIRDDGSLVVASQADRERLAAALTRRLADLAR